MAKKITAGEERAAAKKTAEDKKKKELEQAADSKNIVFRGTESASNIYANFGFSASIASLIFLPIAFLSKSAPPSV